MTPWEIERLLLGKDFFASTPEAVRKEDVLGCATASDEEIAKSIYNTLLPIIAAAASLDSSGKLGESAGVSMLKRIVGDVRAGERLKVQRAERGKAIADAIPEGEPQ